MAEATLKVGTRRVFVGWLLIGLICAGGLVAFNRHIDERAIYYAAFGLALIITLGIEQFWKSLHDSFELPSHFAQRLLRMRRRMLFRRSSEESLNELSQMIGVLIREHLEFLS